MGSKFRRKAIQPTLDTFSKLLQAPEISKYNLRQRCNPTTLGALTDLALRQPRSLAIASCEGPSSAVVGIVANHLLDRSRRLHVPTYPRASKVQISIRAWHTSPVGLREGTMDKSAAHSEGIGARNPDRGSKCVRPAREPESSRTTRIFQRKPAAETHAGRSPGCIDARENSPRARDTASSCFHAPTWQNEALGRTVRLCHPFPPHGQVHRH